MNQAEVALIEAAERLGKQRMLMQMAECCSYRGAKDQEAKDRAEYERRKSAFLHLLRATIANQESKAVSS